MHVFDESKFTIFDIFYDNTDGDIFDASSLAKDRLPMYGPYDINHLIWRIYGPNGKTKKVYSKD